MWSVDCGVWGLEFVNCDLCFLVLKFQALWFRVQNSRFHEGSGFEED